MNERFLRLLVSLGWNRQENKHPGVNAYIKVYPITVNGKSTGIPISVSFFSFDKDELPTEAYYEFVLEPTIRPNSGNRRTVVKGSGRIVCMLDYAGFMTAMKYAGFSHPVAYYKQDAKVILFNQTSI